MTNQNISRITYELGRIEGLAQGSGTDEVEAIRYCVNTILDILDTEFIGEIDFRQKTEVDE